MDRIGTFMSSVFKSPQPLPPIRQLLSLPFQFHGTIHSPSIYLKCCVTGY